MSTLMLGILSKAAYLLIEEGENEHYGITVTGLGADRAAHIYFTCTFSDIS